MQRPNKLTVFMEIAHNLSELSTCRRRKVGCILIDGYGRIIGTGYNGAPSGAPHCLDEPCPGAQSQHGTGLGLCDAIHAEQNALLQCLDVKRVMTVFTTSFPCIHCFKMIANSGTVEIIYAEDYLGHYDAVMELNKKLFDRIRFTQHATRLVPFGADVDPA